MDNKKLKQSILKKFKDNHITHIGAVDGGNDSGGCELSQEIHNILDYSEIDFLEELILNEMGYGSFAGNFSVSANIYFDGDSEIVIEGEDVNYEDLTPIEDNDIDVNYDLSKYEFDRVEINFRIDGSLDNININPILEMGVSRDLEELRDYIVDIIEKSFDKMASHYDYIYECDYVIRKDKKVGVFLIECFKYNSSDININIDLNEE